MQVIDKLFFSKYTCPNCSAEIGLAEISEEFSCKKCESRLKSNKVPLKVVTVVFGVVLLPVFIWLAAFLMSLLGFHEKDYILLKFIIGLLYAMVAVAIYRLFLKVTLANKAMDTG